MKIVSQIALNDKLLHDSSCYAKFKLADRLVIR